jgi:hypothetical protein
MVPGGAIGAGGLVFAGGEPELVVATPVFAGMPPWPPVQPAPAGTTTGVDVSSTVLESASEEVAVAIEKASSEEVAVGNSVLSDRPGMVYVRPSMSVVYEERDSVSVLTSPFGSVM